nr:hypothetical protein AUSP0123_00022 [uncultured phage]
MADSKTPEQVEIENQDSHDVPDVAEIEEVKYEQR